ncbi:MAG: purine-binding chemotaxis protein CheW [Pseudomonadales bacterium]|nr:purine-binding chemotaxis protein CheW [Pseudomonadales bacterium]
MSEKKAFAALRELSRLSRQSAAGLPAQVDVKPYWSGIGFTLFGKKFVAPMGEVSETLEVPPFTHLPGVKGWVKGVANVRGRLLPITDLAEYFGGKLESGRRSQRVLVLEQGEIYSGLMVDGVYGIQRFPVDEYAPVVRGVDQEALKPYLQGTFLDESTAEPWIVFSPWMLTKDEAFFQAAIA